MKFRFEGYTKDYITQKSRRVFGTLDVDVGSIEEFIENWGLINAKVEVIK